MIPTRKPGGNEAPRLTVLSVSPLQRPTQEPGPRAPRRQAAIRGRIDGLAQRQVNPLFAPFVTLKETERINS